VLTDLDLDKACGGRCELLAEVERGGENTLGDGEIVDVLMSADLIALGGGVKEAEAEVVGAGGGSAPILEASLVGEGGGLGEGGSGKEAKNEYTHEFHLVLFWKSLRG